VYCVENGDSLDIVAVDIPIGLNEEYEAGGRFCDREARKCLRGRASSVFPAPVRPVLAASSSRERPESRLANTRRDLAEVGELHRLAAEFCRTDPARLKGIAMINLDDVEDGITELERAARLGLAGAMITEYPLEHRRYDQSEYEPFWAAAEALDLPLSLHTATRRQGKIPGAGDKTLRDASLWQPAHRRQGGRG
jgi:hypothetical protein